MIDPSFLELLACPICDERPPLRQIEGFLECSQCGRRYPVRDGLPDLLPESAIEPENGTTNHA